jgi:hypothetical protein
MMFGDWVAADLVDAIPSARAVSSVAAEAATETGPADRGVEYGGEPAIFNANRRDRLFRTPILDGKHQILKPLTVTVRPRPDVPADIGHAAAA